jgi:hypothetical protein
VETNRLLGELHTLAKRLVPAPGAQQHPVGNRVPGCRARKAPAAAIAFHRLLFAVDRECDGVEALPVKVATLASVKPKKRPARGVPVTDLGDFDRILEEHHAEMSKCDPLGSAGSAQQYKDVCWVKAVRSLGLPVPMTRDGPFRAMQHGSPMLQPLGNRKGSMVVRYNARSLELFLRSGN